AMRPWRNGEALALSPSVSVEYERFSMTMTATCVKSGMCVASLRQTGRPLAVPQWKPSGHTPQAGVPGASGVGASRAGASAPTGRASGLPSGASTEPPPPLGVAAQAARTTTRKHAGRMDAVVGARVGPGGNHGLLLGCSPAPTFRGQ